MNVDYKLNIKPGDLLWDPDKIQNYEEIEPKMPTWIYDKAVNSSIVYWNIENMHSVYLSLVMDEIMARVKQDKVTCFFVLG